MIRTLAPCAALALLACSDDAPEPPGAMTASEAKALQDAAEMIDQRRLPEGALPPAPADGETPAAAAE